MMEQELDQECHINDETQNDEACHKETETEHKGDLPFDFILPMMIIKDVTTLDYQIEKCY